MRWSRKRERVSARLEILDAHQFDHVWLRRIVDRIRENECARASRACELPAGPIDTRPFGAHPEELRAMATANTDPVDDDIPEEPVPVMQQLLDNPFLLLFIGIAMPTVLYIVWGVMEIVGIPVAK